MALSSNELLPIKDSDWYINVNVWKIYQKRSIDFFPYFPIVVRSEFECSKLVPFISDPARLAKNLESEAVKIELFQGSLSKLQVILFVSI